MAPARIPGPSRLSRSAGSPRMLLPPLRAQWPGLRGGSAAGLLQLRAGSGFYCGSSEPNRSHASSPSPTSQHPPTNAASGLRRRRPLRRSWRRPEPGLRAALTLGPPACAPGATAFPRAPGPAAPRSFVPRRWCRGSEGRYPRGRGRLLPRFPLSSGRAVAATERASRVAIPAPESRGRCVGVRPPPPQTPQTPRHCPASW